MAFTNYIIHRSIDMPQLCALVEQSIKDGFQPYGDLIAVPLTTDAFGNVTPNGGHTSIAYIQAMVR